MKKSLDRTFLNYGIRQEDLFLQMVDEESGEILADSLLRLIVG